MAAERRMQPPFIMGRTGRRCECSQTNARTALALSGDGEAVTGTNGSDQLFTEIQTQESVMPLLTTALAHLLIVVLIGIIAGIVMYRGFGSLTGGDVSTSHSQITYMLVGIAGGFIGFHIAVVLGLLPLPLMHYLFAVLGAFLTLFLWRGR
jgi:hypothetical protein